MSSLLLKCIFCDILPEDILSLYTSIPNNEGIATTKKRYSYIHKTLHTKIIITFLALIVTLNNFVFYLQIKGCGLGAICAPAYANIVMAEFKQKYIYPLIEDKSILFLRYIGDTFMIWTKSEKQLKDFMSDFNQKHTSLYNVWLQIWLQANRVPRHFSLYRSTKYKLKTTLFRKSSDRQNFLNAKSKHPYSLEKKIPDNQAIRIHRICSTFQDYHSHSRKRIKLFLIKDKKNMFSYRKFRSLINSIENNCSTNKNLVINNLCHYKQRIVERNQI